MTGGLRLSGRTPPPPPSPRRRRLGDAEFLALVEGLPGISVPADMVPRWPQGLDAGRREEVREGALAQLVATGVLVRAPEAGEGVADVIEPAVLGALVLLESAPVQVQVRSWAGEQAFWGRLALGARRGSALVRSGAVGRGPDGVAGQARDLPGVELSAFPLDAVLAEVLRTVPPVGGRDELTWAGDAANVQLSAADSLAIATALREGARQEVVDSLVDWAGLDDAPGGPGGPNGPGVPEVLEDLALRWGGALEIAVTRRDGRAGTARTLWLLAGRRWVRVSLPGRADPQDPLNREVRLVTVTREEIADAVLAELTAQIGAQT